MATLSITQTLSCADCGTDVLSISNTDSLTVQAPMTNNSRVSIATGSAQSLIPAITPYSYIYIKVISGANASDFVQVLIGGSANIKMRVGEFMFVPIYNNKAVTAEAYGGACVVEIGQWAI